MAYDYLSADARCTSCGMESYFPEIQFKSGICKGIKYLVGSEVELKPVTWRTMNQPQPPVGVRYTVEGIGTCPQCHQIVEFEIGMMDSVILDVTPS